jgi:hypothetical protein
VLLRVTLGAFIRLTKRIAPNIKISQHLRAFTNYRQEVQNLDDQDVAASARVKGPLELMYGRRMFRTEKGALGFAPETLREGDRVVVLLGCQLHVVLRRTGKANSRGTAHMKADRKGKWKVKIKMEEGEDAEWV